MDSAARSALRRCFSCGEIRNPGLKLREMTMGALAFNTVLPAKPPFTALKTTSGSRPARVAKTSAAPMAAILQAQREPRSICNPSLVGGIDYHPAYGTLLSSSLVLLV